MGLCYSLAAELDEDWYHSDDPIKSGISFYVKVRSMMASSLCVCYSVYVTVCSVCVRVCICVRLCVCLLIIIVANRERENYILHNEPEPV